jgi:hypothetical protein
MILTYDELKILQKEVARLKEKGEILDPRNTFERRELHAIIRQLKAIVEKPKSRKPKLKFKIINGGATPKEQT